jgi:hypothetical protein
MNGNNQPAQAVSQDLLPGELVRIYLDPSGRIMYRYRGNPADARGNVASVLAAIDRQLIVTDLIGALARRNDGAL